MTDTVYKPTSEYKPQFYTPSTKWALNTFLSLFGERIITSGTITSGQSVSYTVPQGKTFFITAIIGSMVPQTTNQDIGRIFVNGVQIFSCGAGQASTPTFTNNSISFAVPFKMSNSEIFTINESGNGNFYYSVIGYYIDNSLIQNLI